MRIEVGDEIELGSIIIELVGFGPDESELVEVKPCRHCGELIPFDSKDCPKCFGTVSPRKSQRLDPRQLPDMS